VLRSPNAARHGESGAGDTNDVIGSARGIFIPVLEGTSEGTGMVIDSAENELESTRGSSINRSKCGETGRKCESKGGK